MVILTDISKISWCDIFCYRPHCHHFYKKKPDKNRLNDSWDTAIFLYLMTFTYIVKVRWYYVFVVVSFNSIIVVEILLDLVQGWPRHKHNFETLHLGQLLSWFMIRGHRSNLHLIAHYFPKHIYSIFSTNENCFSTPSKAPLCIPIHPRMFSLFQLFIVQ